MLARSPDTTTATPTAADVSEDDDEGDEEDEVCHKEESTSPNRPNNNSLDEDLSPQVNEVGLDKLSPRALPHATKKPQTKLQVVHI